MSDQDPYTPEAQAARLGKPPPPLLPSAPTTQGGKRVYLRDTESGELVTVEPEHVEAAITTGRYRPADFDDAVNSRAREIRAEQQQGIGGTLAAAQGAYNRGITGGVAPAVESRLAEALGYGQRYNDLQTALRDAHPELQGAAQAFGGMGALAPLAFVPGLGPGAGIAARAGAEALTQGIGAGLYGALETTSDAIEKHKDLSAEMVLSGAMVPALWGAGIGGAIGGLGAAGGRLMRGMVRPGERGAEVALGAEAAERAGTPAAAGVAKPGLLDEIGSIATGESPERLAQMGSPEFKRYASATERQKGIADLSRPIAEGLDEAFPLMEVGGYEKAGKLHAEKYKHQFEGVDDAVVRRETEDFLHSLDETLASNEATIGTNDADMFAASGADPASPVGRNLNFIPQVRQLSTEIRAKLPKLDAAHIHEEMDFLRRRIGARAKGMQHLSVEDQGAKVMRGIYDDQFRPFMESPEIWGPMGAVNKELNALHHPMIHGGAEIDKLFAVNSGRPHPNNPWIGERVISPDKVRGWLEGGGVTGAHPEMIGQLTEYADRSQALAEGFLKHYKLKPEVAAQHEGVIAGAKKLREGITEARRVMPMIEAHAQLAGAANPLKGAANVLPIAGAVLGGPGGWAVGTAAKQAARMAFDPSARMQFTHALSRAIGRGGSGLNESIGTFATRLGQKVAPTGRGIAKGARAAQTGLLYFAAHKPGEDKPPPAPGVPQKVQNFDAHMADLRKLADPRNAGDVTIRVRSILTPQVADAHPEVAAAMLRRIQGAARYLWENAPKTQRPDVLLGQLEQYPPSDAELAEYEAVYDTVMDPSTMFEDLGDGTLTQAQVDAADAVYPALMTEVRATLVESVVSLEHLPPYSDRIQLSILFGVPVDVTMDPEYIAAQQEIHQARWQADQGAGQKADSRDRRTHNETGVNLADDTMSYADKIEKGFSR